MTVPPGPILADALLSSAILAGEDGGAPNSSDGIFDPSSDPELALASVCYFKRFSISPLLPKKVICI